MFQTITPKILVFSTEKISDPAIDMAGLLKMHYPPTVYMINVPCSSSIKPRWIMHAFNKGFGGVFIAADGSDCPYGESCTDKTGTLVNNVHELMKKEKMEPSRLRMSAICSVCSEAFVKHMKNLTQYILDTEIAK